MSRPRSRPGVPDLSRYPLVMRPRHICEVWGITRSTLEKRVARGSFPVPRLTREKQLAFSKADVIAFFEQRTYEAPARRSA